MADQIFSVSGVSATVNPSTWGKGSAWGEGSFNAGGSILIGDSGYVGNTEGWGRYAWGRADWGDTNLITEGWGRLTWGEQGWGNSPGATLTGRFLGTLDNRTKEDREKFFSKGESILTKPATPEYISSVVDFLVSDKSKYISGQVIRVDGGQFTSPI